MGLGVPWSWSTFFPNHHFPVMNGRTLKSVLKTAPSILNDIRVTGCKKLSISRMVYHRICSVMGQTGTRAAKHQITVHKAHQQCCQVEIDWWEGRKEGNNLLEIKCPHIISIWKKTQLGITKAIINVRPLLLMWLFADTSATAQ